MSPPRRRRAPTWRELERFCEADGWTEIRTTGHRFFRKTLATGEVLETHSSLAGGGTMSQGRFAAILRVQLRVTREQFWQTLRTGQPVERPAPVEPEQPTLPLYVVHGLKQAGLSEAEIGRLAPEEALRLFHERWSRSD